MKIKISKYQENWNEKKKKHQTQMFAFIIWIKWNKNKKN